MYITEPTLLRRNNGLATYQNDLADAQPDATDAVLWIDVHGQVVQTNRQAELALASEVIFSRVANRLVPLDATDHKDWQRSLAQATVSNRPSMALLSGEFGRICVALIPGTDRRLEIRFRTADLLERTQLQVFARSLNITACEQEIMRLILAGLKPKAIAGVKFRSEATVRSHVKSVLLKTGCNSVQELVILLAGLPSLT
jgi:DNA-binding CsgD family transcriptional regulator